MTAMTDAPAPARHGSVRRSMRRREAITGYLFILPALIGLLVFFALPTVRALTISFTDWNLLRPAKVIGADNYVRLWSDANFWDSLKITLAYVLWNIPLQTSLALLIAVLADRLAKSVWVRAVIIAPYLISNVVAGLVWLLMLDPLIGITNAFLSVIGSGPQPFLSSPDQAIVSIAGISIWRHVGFTALLFYAGLQSIPKDLYEAARLDGASEFAMFRLITLPLLRPSLQTALILRVVLAFEVFAVVAALGGTVFPVLMGQIYEYQFDLQNSGGAAALALIVLGISIAFTLLILRLLRVPKGASI